MKFKQLQKGFTLFELLTVMLLVTTIGSIVVSIFFLSLRGSSKTASLTTVRQNGNYALSQMSKTIRFARTLDTPSPCSGETTAITVTAQDGSQTVFAYDQVAQTITQNSQSMFNTTELVVPTATFTCVQQSISAPPTITLTFQLATRAPQSLNERTGAINFTTAVALRNWQR